MSQPTLTKLQHFDSGPHVAYVEFGQYGINLCAWVFRKASDCQRYVGHANREYGSNLITLPVRDVFPDLRGFIPW